MSTEVTKLEEYTFSVLTDPESEPKTESVSGKNRFKRRRIKINFSLPKTSRIYIKLIFLFLLTYLSSMFVLGVLAVGVLEDEEENGNGITFNVLQFF